MKYEMSIRVEIRQTERSNYEGINVSETIPFEADNFSELCGVLSRFHELAEEIRKLRGGVR